MRYRADDWLLFGRETDGLPEEVQRQADRQLTIPMPRNVRQGTTGVRSLNLSVAVGVVVFEAQRQLNQSG
jgi:tRNA (cytidine/uridine-2'-O-)-methyltransferase